MVKEMYSTEQGSQRQRGMSGGGGGGKKKGTCFEGRIDRHGLRDALLLEVLGRLASPRG
jgi:hypothetical protein